LPCDTIKEAAGVIRYVSTRGGLAAAPFSRILLEGLAPDGGLVVPESYPKAGHDELLSWRKLSYAQLAFAVLRHPGIRPPRARQTECGVVCGALRRRQQLGNVSTQPGKSLLVALWPWNIWVTC
jgi:hypothetical protein